METIQAITDKLLELKGDKRLYYKTADIFTNAPLALIQLSMETQINTLEWVLGLPQSKFPLISNDKGVLIGIPEIEPDLSVNKIIINRNIWDNYGVFIGTKKVYDGADKADLLKYAATKYPQAKIIDKSN